MCMEAVKDCITEFMNRFESERDRYEEHCHRAAQLVDGLIKQKGIMAIVTSRVKDPDRLQEKLIRRLEREIEKQELLLAELDKKIDAAAADYQELTRLLGEKETAEEVLMELMKSWEEAQE